MLCLAIHIYENGNLHSMPSIRVPLAALSAITKLIPQNVAEAIKQHGIDIEQTVHSATTTAEPCVLMDITDDDDRVVIAIERMQTDKPKQLTGGATQ